MKIEPSKNQEFKSFDIDIKAIGWKKRCELNDMMMQNGLNGKTPLFSFWGDICLKFTPLKEEELNKYSTDEIIAIANKIFEEANKKK